MLQQHDDDGGYEPCVRCGRLAVGPCARCEAPVCGDCCVLTQGGARTFAICLACDARGGRSLRSGWLGVLGFVALPIVGLIVAIVLLALLVEP
jgi:hypothetical protein